MLKKFLGYTLILLSMLILIFIGIQINEGRESLFKLIGPMLLAAMMFYQGKSYIEEKKDQPKINSLPNNSTDSLESYFDPKKREILVNKLKSMEDPVVTIQEFFDGNFSDYGSIGCNIYPNHPGIPVFVNVFDKLLSRDDVDAVYAHVSEIDPGGDCWPYTDCVYVFGAIPHDELVSITKPIEPTEIGDIKGIVSPIPKSVRKLSNEPLNVLWWD